jgi:hypothetical protein
VQPGLLRYRKERNGILSAPLLPLRNSSFLQRFIVENTESHGSHCMATRPSKRPRVVLGRCPNKLRDCRRAM